MEHSDIISACRAFGIESRDYRVEEIKSGHINATFCVTTDDGTEYIVQAVNTSIFKNIEGLMNNIGGVTEHIRRKMIAEGKNPDRDVLHFMTAPSGKLYHMDAKQKAWRIYPKVVDSITYDTAATPKILHSAGEAFGRFQMQLADYDATTLCETIPHFHDTRARLETFLSHVAADPVGRVKSVEEEIKYIRDAADMGLKLGDMLAAGALPLRVTHNDTKCNNVLFDKTTNEPLAVIDLDTIMPGLSVTDFGDAIRFGANEAAEDEPKSELAKCNLDLYRAFAEGFISQTSSALTDVELSHMALGAFTMTYELVIRFLDDYISGDVYFRTEYPEHNLVRTRCQLALARDMQKNFAEMNDIISKLR